MANTHESSPSEEELREQRLQAEVAKNRQAYDQRVQAEESASHKAELRKRVVLVVLVATILFGTGWYVTHRKPAPDRNRSAEFGAKVATKELRLMPRGKWIAKMPESWNGESNPDAAQRTCKAILKAVCPLPDGFSSVEIQSASGAAVIECSSTALDFRSKFPSPG